MTAKECEHEWEWMCKKHGNNCKSYTKGVADIANSNKNVLPVDYFELLARKCKLCKIREDLLDEKQIRKDERKKIVKEIKWLKSGLAVKESDLRLIERIIQEVK